MREDGKIPLYASGEDVSMLLGQDECDTIEDKFVFYDNANTDSRWHYTSRQKTGWTTADLREEIDLRRPTTHTNAMFCLRKAGLKGLFAPYDNPTS